MRRKGFRSVKRVISTLLVISLMLVLGGAAAGASGQDIFENDRTPAEGPLFVPGEILVKFNPRVPEEVIERINDKHGASILEISPWGFMRLGIPKGRSITDMVEVYSRNPNVEYAQPNSICWAVMTPNDSHYSYQWHLYNTEYGGINMESAWDLSTGAGVVVAVLDTGVAYEDYDDYRQAPDLANTSFVTGYDFIDDDSHPNDDESHGTHVTGTIAQSTNNSVGVAGVAFNASIMPVKVLDADGSGTAYTVANGLYFAADNGADVINMSLGWPWWLGRMYDPGPVVHNAVIYAYNKGVTIVAAAGNDGKNQVAYPAAYEECIAVGATQYDEALAPYTNKGAALDLTAPGGNLGLDQNNDGYGDGVLQQTFNPNTKNPADFGYWFFHGTSMATPHVAGVAALVIAAGVSGPDNVRNILESTAEDKGAAGWDRGYGSGIVDAYAALASIGPPNNPPVANANGPYTGTEDVALTFDGSGSYDPDGDPLTYAWDFGDGSTGTGVNPTHVYTAGGTYTVTLVVNDGKVDSEPSTTSAIITEVNDSPVADAGPDQTALVDEVVTFDGSGSDDIDGYITTYDWDFGDETTGTGMTTAHAYATAGTYTVVLTVTDNGGLTDTDMAIVTVLEAPTYPTMHVADITMSLATRTAGRNTFTSGIATVTVVDANGDPVGGVTVYGQWSGLTSDSDSGITDAIGEVALTSDRVKNGSGDTFTFTIADITKGEWTYEPRDNVETSDSITIP